MIVCFILNQTISFLCCNLYDFCTIQSQSLKFDLEKKSKNSCILKQREYPFSQSMKSSCIKNALKYFSNLGLSILEGPAQA